MANFTENLCSWGSDALTNALETSLETSQARSDHTWMGQRVFYKLTVTFSRSKEVSVARVITISQPRASSEAASATALTRRSEAE